jgi:hypothetical protein
LTARIDPAIAPNKGMAIGEVTIIKATNVLMACAKSDCRMDSELERSDIPIIKMTDTSTPIT